MPAVYAHYKFGKKVYRALPEDIRRLVRENAPAYWLGLHGPDLLFYYRAMGKNRVNQLGVRMHRESARFFFEKARRVYQKRPSYVLLSYLCGFLCHFMLDSECHPYISRYMEEHRLGHLEIETDFDRMLMEEDGADPVTHNCTRHLIRDLDTEGGHRFRAGGNHSGRGGREYPGLSSDYPPVPVARRRERPGSSGDFSL